MVKFSLSVGIMDKAFLDKIINYADEKLSSKNVDYVSFFKEIKLKYSLGAVSHIYNYILQNKTDEKLLSQTIREINKNKYITNFEPLLDFIKNTDNINLKVLAIKTISVFKNTKAVPILLGCLKQDNLNYKIKLAAADALGKIGDKNAFDALRIIATNEDEKSTYVKESAVVALGNLGDDRAIDVFSSILSGKEMFLNKFSYLKERIIEAIPKLNLSKSDKAIEIIKNALLEPSSTIRINAIEALMNINSSQSYDLIYDRLKYDDDIEVKKNALIALYNISDKSILLEVIKNDFEDELKFFAQDLLNEYEDSNE